MAASNLSHLQPAQPLAADGGALTRVLRQARVTKDSVVRVTGPAGPTAVLWLYRHGYERAAYVHPNWVGNTAVADALLIPHSCGTEELAELLQGGNCVREGGALIVQASPERFVEGVDSIVTTLRSLGYQVENHISERGRDIYIARRSAISGLKRAA